MNTKLKGVLQLLVILLVTAQFVLWHTRELEEQSGVVQKTSA